MSKEPSARTRTWPSFSRNRLNLRIERGMRDALARYRMAILISSVGVVLFVFLISGRQGAGPVGSSTRQDRAATVIAKGSTVHLSHRGGPVGVAADERTFDALAEALAVNDRQAYEHLFVDGRAFLVQDGVQVLVVNPQANRAQIQILAGYHSGQSGWVALEWLKPTP